jgi:hypothetical protein
MSDIKECWCTTRQASPTDPGQVEIGFYFIENGVLKMCSESGEPNGVTHKLEQGDIDRAPVHPGCVAEADEGAWQLSPADRVSTLEPGLSSFTSPGAWLSRMIGILKRHIAVDQRNAYEDGEYPDRGPWPLESDRERKAA